MLIKILDKDLFKMLETEMFFFATYFQGRLDGLRLDTTWMIFPSTERAESPEGLTSASKIPRVESYLRRCEACLTPPVSLMAMMSRGESLRPCQHLKKFLPIRPNPLMATLSLASVTPFLYPPLLPIWHTHTHRVI